MNSVDRASGLTMDAIDLTLAAGSHAALIRRLSRLSAAADTRVDPTKAMTAFMTRERLGSVVLAEKVALPHARFEGIIQPVVSVVRSTQPVQFEEGSVVLAVGILVPKDEPRQHLELLRFWASLIRLEASRCALLNAPTKEQFFRLLKEHQC